VGHKIGIVTGTRAEYGYFRPLLSAIEQDPRLDLRLYVTGMHLIEEYGNTIQEIERDGYSIADVVDMGSKAMTSDYEQAKSVGKGVVEFANSFNKERPDIVIVLGDRTEAFAAATAATIMNIPVGHIAGGEVGFGDIDHVLRHAITKLAHLHFVQSKKSKERVLKLGEEPWRVVNTGSLTLDTITQSKLSSKEEISQKYDFPQDPYILVAYHPTTTEWKQSRSQIEVVLESVARVSEKHSMGIVIIYPNDYPGGTEILGKIKEFTGTKSWLKVFANLPHLDYISLMKESAVFVGNSSSGIIEAPSLGVAYVCVGTRQKERERARNVIDVGYDSKEIIAAIENAIEDDKFLKIVKTCKTPYGDGTASQRIIETLVKLDYDLKLLQKKMTY